MATSTSELWLIAGPNGAGKTTFAQGKPLRDLISHVTLLNADDLTLELLRASGFSSFDDPDPETLRATFIEAADRTFEELQSRLMNGEAVAVETVLSTDKYQPLVVDVAGGAGFVGLIYVALSSPDIACQRVRSRHRQGGHDVSNAKIRARWQRSLDTLPWFAARADLLLVYDNSDDDPKHPPRLIASGHRGRIAIHAEQAIPEVTAALKSVNPK